jgi:hypothetical protein
MLLFHGGIVIEKPGAIVNSWPISSNKEFISNIPDNEIEYCNLNYEIPGQNYFNFSCVAADAFDIVKIDSSTVSVAVMERLEKVENEQVVSIKNVFFKDAERLRIGFQHGYSVSWASNV